MALTLDNLKPPRLAVKIKFEYGREEEIVLQLMSVIKWEEIGTLVIDPVVPKTLIGKNGEKLPNVLDVAYQRDKTEAATKRLLLRLAYAIAEGGSLDLPGATLEEKAKVLGDVDAGIINTLAIQLERAVFGGQGESAQQRADSFFEPRRERHEDLPTLENDAE